MKRTFSFFSKRNALLCLMLTGFLFLLGTNSMNAQESARGYSNPESSIAQKFNVTAYDILTFDPAETIAALNQIAAGLKPLLTHSATPAQKMKYQYVSAVIRDVEGLSIAVEISLLKQLDKLSTTTKIGGSNQTSSGLSPQYSNLYNEIVTAIQ